MSTPVLNKPGLLSVIQACVAPYGLSPAAVSWALDPQAIIGDVDRAKVTLQVFGMKANGVDEHRYIYNDPAQPANSLETLELGNREVKVTVKVEAFDYEVEAAEIIDVIRTSIRTERNTLALNAISLAFIWAEEATPVRMVINEREVNVAVADFTFGGVAQQVSSVAVDGSDNDITWIQTVNGNNVVPGTFS